MSGLAAFVAAPGRPAAPDMVAAMLARLSRRGRPGPVRVSGRCALGSAERPAQEAAAPGQIPDRIAIAADMRLDDADALAATLGCPGAPSGVLLAAAYRRWGARMLDRMDGDFAILLWDGDAQTLLAARDRFGCRPLFWRQTARGVAIASEIKALDVFADEPLEPTSAGVLDFLTSLGEPETTPYGSVARLPGAHVLTVSSQGATVTRYWSLRPVPLEPRRSHERPERFRELMARSVLRRLGDDHPALLLSGGLDSSTITALASRLKPSEILDTYSVLAGTGPEEDERGHMDAVLAGGRYEPHFLPLAPYRPLDGLESVIEEQDGPFFAPGLALLRKAYAAATGQGHAALLDGHGGDEVVSSGIARLGDLARAARFLSLYRQTSALAQAFGRPRLRTTWTMALRHGPHRRVLGPPQDEAWDYGPWLNREFAERAGYRSLRASSTDATSTRPEQEAHVADLSDARWNTSFEVLDRMAATEGIEPRFPFFDRELVEFCVSVESDEKLDAGWTRLLLRRGMEGVLPPSVQWRRDKYDFSHTLSTGMIRHHRAMLDDLFLAEPFAAGDYLDTDRVREAYRRMVADPERSPGPDTQMIWRAIVLATWLRQRRARLPVSEGPPAASPVVME